MGKPNVFLFNCLLVLTSGWHRQTRSHLLTIGWKNRNQRCLVADIAMGQCKLPTLSRCISSLWRSGHIEFWRADLWLFVLPHQQFSAANSPGPSIVRTTYRNGGISFSKCQCFVDNDRKWQSKWLYNIIFGPCNDLIGLHRTSWNTVPAKTDKKSFIFFKVMFGIFVLFQINTLSNRREKEPHW